MKNTLIILLLLNCFFGYSQDVIEKKNGTKIQCKVLKIDELNIEYKAKNEEAEPLRSIRISSINRIIYANGSIEDFGSSTYDSRGREVKKRDPIFKSGFYLDGLIGATSAYRSQPELVTISDGSGGLITVAQESFRMRTFFSHGFRLGNKWYFGKNERRRFGINATWFRVAALMNADSGELYDVLLSPVNIGFSGVFRFKKNIGLEVNTYTGTSTYNKYSALDLLLGLNTKLRLGSFSLGLDYGYTTPTSSSSLFPKSHSHNFNLSIGIKF